MKRRDSVLRDRCAPLAPDPLGDLLRVAANGAPPLIRDWLLALADAPETPVQTDRPMPIDRPPLAKRAA